MALSSHLDELVLDPERVHVPYGPEGVAHESDQGFRDLWLPAAWFRWLWFDWWRPNCHLASGWLA